MVFAKQNKTTMSKMSPGLFSPAPPRSNEIEINKSLVGGGGGREGGLIEDFGT